MVKPVLCVRQTLHLAVDLSVADLGVGKWVMGMQYSKTKTFFEEKDAIPMQP